MRGTLVVFEGLDRAGKTTQCSLLVARLQACGHRVHQMRFPDRTTPIGQMIDRYLAGAGEQEDHVIHLLFSANRWEAAAKIRYFISKGTTVVIDRYYYSGCVYSAAKENPSLSLEWARQPEAGLPRPDLVVYLDISLEEVAQRGGFGRERYETLTMQERVRSLFAELRARQHEAEDFAIINAGKTETEVAESVEKAVTEAMRRVAEQDASLRVVEPWQEVDSCAIAERRVRAE